MKALQKKNPKIKKAFTKLKFVSHDKNSREMYEARLKTEFDYKARLAFDIEQARLQGRIDGKIEGMLEGKIEGKIETAKELLKSGMSREQICKITGLKDSDF